VDRQWLWIWRAWHRLCDDRPHYAGGMGPPIPGNIPWSIVRLWASEHKMSEGEFAMLDTCIQRMDSAYRDWWLMNNAAHTSKPKPGPS
jgi:hypothetical protein